MKGVIGEREKRGLEKFDRKNLSGEVRRQEEEGVRRCVGGLGLEDFKQLCVSLPEVYSDSLYRILRDTL